jgi:hypothetical protein
MSTMIQLKKAPSPIVVTLALIALALSQFGAKTFGVVPPPDGGYANFTTAEGQNALNSLTNGAGNTGVGWFSLFSDTNASFNTGVGVGTLLFNNAEENTAVGAATLLFNTASGNTAIGSRALLNNTTGGTITNIQGVDIGPNVAVGQQALESNTLAGANTAVGYQALENLQPAPWAWSRSVFARPWVSKRSPMPPASASPITHLATTHS